MKIAFSSEHVAQLNAPYGVGDRATAIKLGFARYLSENQISPLEAERILTEVSIEEALNKEGFIQNSLLALAGAGAVLGGGAGVAWNRLSQASSGQDDSEAGLLRKKLNNYARMKQEILENLSAHGAMPPQISAPEVARMQQMTN